MKFKISKQWLEKHAENDDKAEISAGGIDLEDLIAEANMLRITQQKEELLAPAFGKLINLCRRKRGYSIEKLAEEAQVEVAELYKVERDLHYRPEPRTVYQLSHLFHLPNDKLLQLSGNMVVRDSHFQDSAVRFAARSESVDKLSREEHVALEEFVKLLSEQE